MSGVILGTAGHIDHGKTALVRALTGVDTDRLREEKARGITIELGFAELVVEEDVRFGVVDVPGHEAFVRAMVAGAAGMDVVLLVVAADEGVMPQTREHLAIVGLLGVPELVVAVTKCDLVDEEWIELVTADIEQLLEGTRYAGAGSVRTSVETGQGLEELVSALADAAGRVRASDVEDLVRLPLDRVFTIRGTGTVATGTLWSGSLKVGERVRAMPHDVEARVRGLQVHDQEVETAHAGDRTAVALSGDAADRAVVGRGAVLVTSPAWSSTRMLTARVRLLPHSEWTLAHNQRVHLHHATAEILARCSLLEGRELAPGETGWVQLRLEAPLTARARDPFVIRAYSPVTTIGGGVIAEALPGKRNHLDAATLASLEAILDGSPEEAVQGCLTIRGWRGAAVAELPVHVGLSPSVVSRALEALEASGAVVSSQRAFAAEVGRQGGERIVAAVGAGHVADPLRPCVPLASARDALPRWASPELADALLSRLVSAGALELFDGGVRLPGHRPRLSGEQEGVVERLRTLFASDGLGVPAVDELPGELAGREDIWSLLRHLEAEGAVRSIADGIFVGVEALEAAAERVQRELGGRQGLGPADFKDALPVTRKRLIPLLNYFDGRGVTVRSGDGRDVPESG